MLAAQKLNAFAKIDLGKRMLWARSEAVNRIDLFGSEKVKMHPPLSGCDKRKAGEIADVFPELKNGFVAAVPGVNVDDAQTGPAEMDAEIGVALLDQPTNLIGLQVVRTVPPLHAGAFANPAALQAQLAAAKDREALPAHPDGVQKEHGPIPDGNGVFQETNLYFGVGLLYNLHSCTFARGQ